MKYYTVVNEVEALQRAYAVCLSVCMYNMCVCQCALLYEWGFVCLEVAVIMLPSKRLSRENKRLRQEEKERER